MAHSIKTLSLSIASVFVIVACSGQDPGAAKPPVKPVASSLLTLEKKTLFTPVRVDAVVRLKEGNYPVVAEVGGVLRGELASAGDWVKKGQVVAQLEGADLADRLTQARNERLRLEAQHAEAKRTDGENKVLLEKDYISQSAYRASATAVQALGHQLAAARAAEAVASRAVANSQLRAPIDGQISQRLVVPGQYVPTGTTLFEVLPSGLSTDKLELELTLPERADTLVRPGVMVSVPLPDRSEVKLPLLRRQPGVSGNGTFKAYTEAPPGLTPGRSLSVLVQGQREDARPALVVPDNALVLDGSTQKAYVFVADNGVARKKEIAPGASLNGWTEISGLAEGSRIAVSGAAFLRDGAPVQDAEQPTPAEPKAAKEAK